jgi:hypothetical protein
MLEDQLEEKSKKVEFDVDPEILKPKVKKVDFWNQTDLRKKKDTQEQPKQRKPKQKPWVCDFSEFVKNSPPNNESEHYQAESRFENQSNTISHEPYDYKESIDSKDIPKNRSKDKFSSGSEIRFSGYEKKYSTDPKDMKFSTDSKEYKQSAGSREMVYSVSKATSSGSSMSHYNPTEDMKKFYRNEFGKFLESRGTNKDEDSEY